jgi:putative acetyltransferase
VRIVTGGLDDPRVRALLEHHARSSRAETARDSAHALDPDDLASPEITLWSAWDGDAVVGVGALRTLSETHGEIKAMHTVESHRRSGVGSAILRRIVETARERGMTRLSLETGSWPYFRPAIALYRRHGFVECPPFAGYAPDPNSVFMTLAISPEEP